MARPTATAQAHDYSPFFQALKEEILSNDKMRQENVDNELKHIRKGIEKMCLLTTKTENQTRWRARLSYTLKYAFEGAHRDEHVKQVTHQLKDELRNLGFKKAFIVFSRDHFNHVLDDWSVLAPVCLFYLLILFCGSIVDSLYSWGHSPRLVIDLDWSNLEVRENFKHHHRSTQPGARACGNVIQECAICHETREMCCLSPCGHICCSACHRGKCPFCRTLVKGIPLFSSTSEKME